MVRGNENRPLTEMVPIPHTKTKKQGGKMTQRALSTLSEEEQSFQEAIRQFAKAEILPKRQEMDEKEEIASQIIPSLFGLGIMGIEIPEELGGTGASFFTACLAIEELAKVDGSVSVVVDVQNTLVINALMRWCNEAQKQKYLPKLAREWVGAYALSESSSGSDAFAMKLKAEKKKDHYVLNGHKMWITNAKEAHFFIVFASTDFSQAHKGICAFLVEKNFPGFSVAKKESKLGIRASSTCELLFSHCEVPSENVLGPLGKGYKIAIETLNEGRIGIGAQMTGIAQGAYDYALQYIQEREQFGKKIASFQGIQFQLSDMRTQIEAARLLVYNAARLKDSGRDFVQEAAMAKLFASEMAERVTSCVIDFLGGNGFSKEYPAEKFWRDAKIGQIYEGTSNMQRQTIAKVELGSLNSK